MVLPTVSYENELVINACLFARGTTQVNKKMSLIKIPAGGNRVTQGKMACFLRVVIFSRKYWHELKPDTRSIYYFFGTQLARGKSECFTYSEHPPQFRWVKMARLLVDELLLSLAGKVEAVLADLVDDNLQLQGRWLLSLEHLSKQWGKLTLKQSLRHFWEKYCSVLLYRQTVCLAGI